MTRQVEIANIINGQISGNTFACVGASDKVALPQNENQDGGLLFRARIKSSVRNYIQVLLNYNDTYTVEQIQVRANVRKVTYRAENVYNTELSETVYRIGSTNSPSKGFLEEYGIHKVKAK